MKSILNSKFFIVLTLCMCIFGCTAFADVNDGPYRYYINYNDKSYSVELWTETPVTVSNSNLYFTGEGSYYAKYSTGNTFRGTYYDGRSYTSTLISVISQIDKEADSTLPGEEDDDDTIIIPGDDVDSSIDLDISDSVKTIPNDLINNLKFLVPMGVGLLALFVGVSLTSRIFYKFL